MNGLFFHNIYIYIVYVLIYGIIPPPLTKSIIFQRGRAKNHQICNYLEDIRNLEDIPWDLKE